MEDEAIDSVYDFRGWCMGQSRDERVGWLVFGLELRSRRSVGAGPSRYMNSKGFPPCVSSEDVPKSVGALVNHL